MKKILLSIKPCFVEEILSGRKSVEYRKRIPKDDNTRQVLIYASYPVKRVVAEFTIDKYFSGTPKSLWEQTCGISGISKEVFDLYFKDRKMAFAYHISNLRFLNPLRKLEDYGVKFGPQDFCYIED